MIYRDYGKSGDRVSAIGFGTARLSGEMGSNVKLVEKALEEGINYFDTAPTYACGLSEKILGMAFKNNPQKDIYVVSKSMLSADPTADDVLRRIEASLDTMHLEKINYFHMWSVLNFEQYQRIIAHGGPYEGALRAKEQGLIDHICFSAHCNGDEVKQIISAGLFDGVTLGFNALNYRHRLSGIRYAAENGLGIAIMNPLAGGLIPRNSDYFQALQQPGYTIAQSALQFVMAHKEISTVLVGIANENDLYEALQAMDNEHETEESFWHEKADSILIPKEPLCTMCNYCKGCPQNIAIDRVMGGYNEYLLSGYDEDHLHEWRKMFCGKYPFETISCIKCGRCEIKCTQHLPIMNRIEELNSICEREAANQKKLCDKYFPNNGYPITGIYGLSIDAETLIKAYQYFYHKIPDDVYFFDSNSAKWGTQVLDTGKVVHNPRDIMALGIKRIIISARKYEKEIRDYLKQYTTEDVEIHAL